MCFIFFINLHPYCPSNLLNGLRQSVERLLNLKMINRSPKKNNYEN